MAVGLVPFFFKRRTKGRTAASLVVWTFSAVLGRMNTEGVLPEK
jgi:hypothetical protein